MSKQRREVFLIALLSKLLPRYPQWLIKDHTKLEWLGQPRNMWPEADLFLNVSGRKFIVEYDEDSDPGRSVVKYWPILQQSGEVPVTIIEVWKRGPTIGQGYATLAKWMGVRLMELYPTFTYEFIERTGETAATIADKVGRIIESKLV